MSKVILSIMVSLDGYIAGPKGDLEWHRADEEFESEMFNFLHTVDHILLGRVSYELLADYWPTAGKTEQKAPGGFTNDQIEISFAELLNSIPKVVYSRTLQHAKWGPARIVRDDIEGDLERMKRESAKDIVLFAGAQIAQYFMERDLIDEYRLMVHPILLGEGLPLFGKAKRRDLRLVRTRVFASGVTLLDYMR